MNTGKPANTCTEKECDTESTLYLCEEHRMELADLLDNVDFLIVNLDPNIQAGKVVKKPGGQEGGNGTKSAGSRPPVELDANQVRYSLWELPRNAYIEARDNPQAGRTLFMARIWVGNARTLVYGPEEIRIITTCDCGGKVSTTNHKPVPTDQNPDPEECGQCQSCGDVVTTSNRQALERVDNKTPKALKTRDALKWIRENSRISIKSTDVRNWAREGKIKRTNPEDEKARPSYNVADILAIHYQHANANKRMASF